MSVCKSGDGQMTPHWDMTEKKKIEILTKQLYELKHGESNEVERLKAEIIRLGYVPDRSTW